MKPLTTLTMLLAVGVTLAAQQPLFRAAIEVVLLDVSVTRGGKPVSGLTARDFVLTDNGVPQEIDSVSLQQLPLDVTLVVDTSQSVAGERMGNLIGAGTRLAAALRRDDQLAVVSFSHRVHLEAPLTTNMESARAALRKLRAGGSTALRDAAFLGMALRPDDRRRSLMLLFTDGHDSASWLTEDDVIESARRAAVVVHVVSVESGTLLNGPRSLGPRRLRFVERLAEVSGGRMWSATSDRQLDQLFTRALEEMRARYLLTYSPSGERPPGWHALSVKLRQGRADITARPGYFLQ